MFHQKIVLGYFLNLHFDNTNFMLNFGILGDPQNDFQSNYYGLPVILIKHL